MNLDLSRIPENILERTYFCPITGCWIFYGADSGNGYGKARYEGKMWMTHRVIWTRLVGPIPPGYVLDHRRAVCRLRCCGNPEHMEPVTVAINTYRGDAALFRRAAFYYHQREQDREEHEEFATGTTWGGFDPEANSIPL